MTLSAVYLFSQLGFVIPSLGKKPGTLIVVIGQCVVSRDGHSVKAMDISVYLDLFGLY